jgi:hypothetical protein
MKKMNLLFLAMTVTFVSGCVNNSALIRTSSTSIRNDIFQELSNGGSIPAGYADLRITSSLKTHKPGIYSAKDIHGTADYKIIMNIDGQAAELHSDLRRENTDAGTLRDPEAGEGMRYHFSKNIRIKTGTHKVVIAIPSDDLAIEREITLRDGSSNSLTLEPVYSSAPGKRRPAFYGVTSFSEGLKGFRVIFNGKPL